MLAIEMKKRERVMKTSVIALAFVAVAAMGSSQAVAQDAAFERMDADKSGDVSLAEFVAAGNPRVTAADKDGDGKVTLEQLSASLSGNDAAARDLMDRFDTNKDGTITRAEVDARRASNFKKLDANADGKLQKSEMPGGQ